MVSQSDYLSIIVYVPEEKRHPSRGSHVGGSPGSLKLCRKCEDQEYVPPQYNAHAI